MARHDPTAVKQISLAALGVALLAAAAVAWRFALAHAEAAGLWGEICGAAPVLHCAWCGVSLALAAMGLGSLFAAASVPQLAVRRATARAEADLRSMIRQ